MRVASVARDELGGLEIRLAIGLELIRIGHGEMVRRLAEPVADHSALRNHRSAVLGPVFPGHVCEFRHKFMVAAASDIQGVSPARLIGTCMSVESGFIR